MLHDPQYIISVCTVLGVRKSAGAWIQPISLQTLISATVNECTRRRITVSWLALAEYK